MNSQNILSSNLGNQTGMDIYLVIQASRRSGHFRDKYGETWMGDFRSYDDLDITEFQRYYSYKMNLLAQTVRAFCQSVNLNKCRIEVICGNHYNDIITFQSLTNNRQKLYNCISGTPFACKTINERNDAIVIDGSDWMIPCRHIVRRIENVLRKDPKRKHIIIGLTQYFIKEKDLKYSDEREAYELLKHKGVEFILLGQQPDDFKPGINGNEERLSIDGLRRFATIPELCQINSYNSNLSFLAELGKRISEFSENDKMRFREYEKKLKQLENNYLKISEISKHQSNIEILTSEKKKLIIQNQKTEYFGLPWIIITFVFCILSTFNLAGLCINNMDIIKYIVLIPEIILIGCIFFLNIEEEGIIMSYFYACVSGGFLCVIDFLLAAFCVYWNKLYELYTIQIHIIGIALFVLLLLLVIKKVRRINRIKSRREKIDSLNDKIVSMYESVGKAIDVAYDKIYEKYPDIQWMCKSKKIVRENLLNDFKEKTIVT